jgi:hypothetical protein
MFTWLEDVGDLAEEHKLMEDTLVGIPREVDLHVEGDLAVSPRSMMQHESTGDDMSMSEHIVMNDSSQRHAQMYGGIQRGVLTGLQQHLVMRSHLHHFSSCMGDGRRRLVYQQLEELPMVVPDDWGLVMATGKQLSGV